MVKWSCTRRTGSYGRNSPPRGRSDVGEKARACGPSLDGSPAIGSRDADVLRPLIEALAECLGLLDWLDELAKGVHQVSPFRNGDLQTFGRLVRPLRSKCATLVFPTALGRLLRLVGHSDEVSGESARFSDPGTNSLGHTGSEAESRRAHLHPKGHRRTLSKIWAAFSIAYYFEEAPYVLSALPPSGPFGHGP
jgi:hypothetical protein